jgi:gliding motility-associated-like protein
MKIRRFFKCHKKNARHWLGSAVKHSWGSGKPCLALSLWCLLLALPAAAQQICGGNLGENIFTAGDFGSGTTNLLPFDPGIAPGYIYTLSPPPNDGLYTITNNMASWPFLFPGWLAITDNSDDPNGYMMVVNASYAPGAFYEQTVEGLCDNTLYVFSADIFNIISTPTPNYIKPNVSFLLNEQVRYTTGEIPQNQQWNTHGFTFTTAPGETAVKLTLRNNAPGGIGNDLALDNISFRACGPQALILPLETANICEDGEPIALEATIVGSQYPNPAIQWQQSFDQGATWSNIPGAASPSFLHTQLAAGYYYYRYLLASSPENLANAKCRVISNVKVVYVQPKFFNFSDTICEGLLYPFGGSMLSARDTYTHTFLSSLGCDSIVTLQLEVVPDLDGTADLEAVAPTCYGDQDGAIIVSNLRGFYPPVSVSLAGGGSLLGEGSFPNLRSGLYWLSFSDRFGCALEAAIELENPPLMYLDLGPDREIKLAQSLRLPALSNYPLAALEWMPDYQVFCELPCLSPLLQPFETTVYFFTGTSPAGCQASDTLTIRVEELREVYIPNAFSPNEDGRNDRLTLFAAPELVREILHAQIFDRWGGLVFEARNFPPNDLSRGWDGRFKAQELPAGVFAYHFEVQFIDGRVAHYSGALHLVR